MDGAKRERTATVVESGTGPYGQYVTSGRHVFGADEPEALGGRDTGPDPYELLLAALGACTSTTIRLYAERHKWPLERVEVRLRHARAGTPSGDVPDLFERVITLTGALSDEQRQRLFEIAGRCPVSRTLRRASEIGDTLAPAESTCGREARWPTEQRSGAGCRCRLVVVAALLVAIAALVVGVVAARAVLDVADAFFQVLGHHAALLMLVAAIASVPAIVPAGVARRACDVVIGIERKDAAMVEHRWLPACAAMALRTGRGRRRRAMERIAGGIVTRATLRADFRLQQTVIERKRPLARKRGRRMIAMACGAVLLDKSLMKHRAPPVGLDRNTFRRATPDIGHHVTRHATLGRGALKGRVTGEAVVLQRLVRGHQLAGADHLVRIDERECYHAGKRHADERRQPAPDHRHPQNMKTATMCAVANTAKDAATPTCTFRHCRTRSNARLSQ